MGNTYELDDGSELFSFKNKRGEVFCEFAFNPSDTGILERYESIENFFKNYDNPVKTDEDIIRANKDISEQIDYLLGGGVSESLFKKCKPFAPLTNGNFFFESALELIVKIVEEKTTMRLDAKMQKIKKATAKYHK